MAFPNKEELQGLLNKWSKHYGYERISMLPSENPQTLHIRLSYKNGFNYHFNAIDMETVKSKVTSFKPKIQPQPEPEEPEEPRSINVPVL